MRYATPAALRAALEHRLLARSVDSAVSLARLRRRVLLERLLSRIVAAEPGLWVLKGGMALEVRLGDRARVTKDVDLGLREALSDAADLHERIAGALSEDRDGDRFVLRADPPIPLHADGAGPLTWRLKVDAELAGKASAAFRSTSHRGRTSSSPRTSSLCRGRWRSPVSLGRPSRSSTSTATPPRSCTRCRGPSAIGRTPAYVISSTWSRWSSTTCSMPSGSSSTSAGSGRSVTIGVRSFGRGIFHKEPVTGLDLGSKRVFRIEPGDLVISNVFAWEGAVAVASTAEVGKIGSHRFMTFASIDSRVDTAWASWFFRSEPGLELIRRASPGSAGRNRTLAIERFEALEIPLPSPDVQRQTAGRLDKIERLASRMATSARTAERLVDACRVASALTDATGSGSENRMRRARLGDVATHSPDEVEVDSLASYDIAGVYSFGRGLFARSAIDGAGTSYRTLRRLRAGQLVMSRLKAWEGALAVVPPELDGRFVSPEFPAFDLDREQVDPRYLEVLVTAEQFWSGLRPKGIGARRERVSAERLLEQEIDLPPIDEQRRVASLIDKLAAVRTLRDKADARLDAVVPAALNEAFAGLS